MFNIRNAVLVALMQVGMIVGGVLGAGTSRRCWTAFDPQPVPPSISQVIHYGPIALVIPLVWILTVLLVRLRPELTDDARNLAFFSGVVILLILGLFISYSILGPWFSLHHWITRETQEP